MPDGGVSRFSTYGVIKTASVVFCYDFIQNWQDTVLSVLPFTS